MENQVIPENVPQGYFINYPRGYPQFAKNEEMEANAQMQGMAAGANWGNPMIACNPGAYSPEIAAMMPPQGGNYVMEQQVVAPPPGAPYSFMMPVTGQMTENGAGDAQMQAFQQAFGGNFHFYDANAFGTGAALPHGFTAGYESVGQYDEPKKAKKKVPANDPPIRMERKKMFSCC